MSDGNARVVAGVDAHADTHQVAVLDLAGRLLANAQFPATAAGYRELLDWIESHGAIERVGVESTGSFAAALVRFLCARGVKMVEVNQPHPHARYRRGKSDPLDAELAARAALSGAASAIPKHSGGIVEAIRQLALARASGIKARSAALNQLDDLIITAPAPLRSALDNRKTQRGRQHSASSSAPTAAACTNRSRQPSSRSAASPDASATLTLRSTNSTAASARSSPPLHRRRPHCSASAPSTRRNCSSPPAKTSTASKAKPPSPASAPPPRSPPPPAAQPGTDSTPPATGRLTAPST